MQTQRIAAEMSLAGVCCDVAHVPPEHLTWSEMRYSEWCVIHFERDYRRADKESVIEQNPRHE